MLNCPAVSFKDLINTNQQKVNIDTVTYRMLLSVLQKTIGRHRLDPIRHRFMHTTDDVRSDLQLWGEEVQNAITTIVQHASLARKQSEGYYDPKHLKWLF